MSLNPRYDVLRTAFELRDQMASARRRTGLLLGAGVSIAAGLPGLEELTRKVVENLATSVKRNYETIQSKLGSSANIEAVLDRVRLIRDLVSDSTADYEGITGERAKTLDIAICQE